MFLSIKTEAWPGPLSRVNLQCQLLSISLVLFLVSLGRQADSTVTCECSHNWLSCLSDKCPPHPSTPVKLQRDQQRSQQLKVIFKNRKDCFKLFLEFHFNILHDRSQRQQIRTCLTPVTNMAHSLKTWNPILCLLLDSIFSVLDILQKVSQEKSLDARHQAEALRPAGHWYSFISPRNGNYVKS